MKLGIVGLPNVGKSTLFNALTGGNAETGSYSNAAAKPNIGQAKVPDTRLDWLAEYYHPKKYPDFEQRKLRMVLTYLMALA